MSYDSIPAVSLWWHQLDPDVLYHHIPLPGVAKCARVAVDRTAVLLALAAISVRLSGAPLPSLSPDLYNGGGGYDAVVEWTYFVSKGLALELLAAHFAGIASALACM